MTPEQWIAANPEAIKALCEGVAAVVPLDADGFFTDEDPDYPEDGITMRINANFRRLDKLAKG